MSAIQFLEYHLSALIAQYGADAVVTTLAGRLMLSEADLRATLEAVPAQKKKKSGHTPKKQVLTADEQIQRTIDANPDKAAQLNDLRNRYENKSFLPELRDVKRFCEQRRFVIRTVKSRQEFLPRLIKFLASLDSNELASLIDDSADSHQSTLGMISDEVLRKNRS